MTFTNSDWQAAIVSLANNGIPNTNPDGQTTMSASAPVVIASDQTPVAVKGGAASGVATPTNPLVTGMNAFNNLVLALQSAGIVGTIGTNKDLLLAIAQYQWTSGGGVGNNVFVRTPSVFKTASATASGDTAVWTPFAGSSFRLLRYRLEVTANAAQSVAGVITIVFRDATTATNLSHSVFVPSTAGTTMGQGYATPWIDLGQGLLSAAANNVLNINLSAGLTAGNVRVVTAGTED